MTFINEYCDYSYTHITRNNVSDKTTRMSAAKWNGSSLKSHKVVGKRCRKDTGRAKASSPAAPASHATPRRPTAQLTSMNPTFLLHFYYFTVQVAIMMEDYPSNYNILFHLSNTRPGGRQRVGAARACAKRPHLSCGCNRLKLKDWVHARRARADFMESLLPRTRAGRGGTARLEGRGEVSLVFIECGRWMSCYESPDRFGSAPRAPCLRRGCVLLSSAAAHSLRTAQF